MSLFSFPCHADILGALGPIYYTSKLVTEAFICIPAKASALTLLLLLSFPIGQGQPSMVTTSLIPHLSMGPGSLLVNQA